MIKRLISVILMIDAGYICWLGNQGLTEQLFAGTDMKCVEIPANDECISDKRLEEIFTGEYGLWD